MPYSTIPPGQTSVYQTYPGHAWVARDAEGGQLLRINGGEVARAAAQHAHAAMRATISEPEAAAATARAASPPPHPASIPRPASPPAVPPPIELSHLPQEAQALAATADILLTVPPSGPGSGCTSGDGDEGSAAGRLVPLHTQVLSAHSRVLREALSAAAGSADAAAAVRLGLQGEGAGGGIDSAASLAFLGLLYDPSARHAAAVLHDRPEPEQMRPLLSLAHKLDAPAVMAVSSAALSCGLCTPLAAAAGLARAHKEELRRRACSIPSPALLLRSLPELRNAPCASPARRS